MNLNSESEQSLLEAIFTTTKIMTAPYHTTFRVPDFLILMETEASMTVTCFKTRGTVTRLPQGLGLTLR